MQSPYEHGLTGLESRKSRRRLKRAAPFTDRFLARLKPTSRSFDVLDPSRKGLLLRVTPNGVKTLYFRYQQSLQVTRLMIGRYPATTLKVAYETHGDLVKALNRAEDVRVNLPPGVRLQGSRVMAHPRLSSRSATREGVLRPLPASGAQEPAEKPNS